MEKNNLEQHHRRRKSHSTGVPGDIYCLMKCSSLVLFCFCCCYYLPVFFGLSFLVSPHTRWRNILQKCWRQRFLLHLGLSSNSYWRQQCTPSEDHFLDWSPLKHSWTQWEYTKMFEHVSGGWNKRRHCPDQRRCRTAVGWTTSARWENFDFGTGQWSTGRWCWRFVKRQIVHEDSKTIGTDNYELFLFLVVFIKKFRTCWHCFHLWKCKTDKIWKIYICMRAPFFLLLFLLTGLQATTITLDYRVTTLEENGGGNANITELETRVSQLEVTTGQLETRITTNQERIEGSWKTFLFLCPFNGKIQ